MTTVVFNRKVLAGKRRIVKGADLEMSDDLHIIPTIFALDIERIAAAR